MKIVKQDILTDIDKSVKRVVIAHGCNCFHTMDAGIAGYLSKKYPVILEKDKETIYGAKNKLGTAIRVSIDDKLTIYNCYTQYKPGVDARIEAVSSSLIGMVQQECDDVEYRLPQIGCGIGGLNWYYDIKHVYETIFSQESLVVYYL